MSVCGTGFLVQFPIFLQSVQHFHDFVANAAEAGLVAAEAGEDAGFVVEGAEGEGVADVYAAGFELVFDVGFAAADFDLEEGGLVGPDAVEAPAGGDELFHQVGFEGIAGLELDEVEVAEGAEVVLGLIFEEDAAGGESMGDAGGVGAGAALGGDGTAGFGAIGAGRIDASLGRHGGPPGSGAHLRVAGMRVARGVLLGGRPNFASR